MAICFSCQAGVVVPGFFRFGLDQWASSGRGLGDWHAEENLIGRSPDACSRATGVGRSVAERPVAASARGGPGWAPQEIKAAAATRQSPVASSSGLRRRFVSRSPDVILRRIRILNSHPLYPTRKTPSASHPSMTSGSARIDPQHSDPMQSDRGWIWRAALLH